MQETVSQMIGHDGPIYLLGLSREEITTPEPIELTPAAGEAALDALLLAGQYVERESDREKEPVIRPAALHIVIPSDGYAQPLRYFQRPEEAAVLWPVLHIVAAIDDAAAFAECVCNRMAELPRPEGLALAEGEDLVVRVIHVAEFLRPGASITRALRDWSYE